MTKRRTLLDMVAVTSACSVSWDDMSGAGDVRYCSACNKNVHDFSSMTRAEADALLRSAGGRLCGRITRLPDGSIETRPDVSGYYSPARKASPAAAAVMTAVLSIGAPTVALSNVSNPRTAEVVSIQTRPGTLQTADAGGGSASLAGEITGDDKLPVAGAKVSLENMDNDLVLTTFSNATGSYRIDGAPEGTYMISVTADGYEAESYSGIELLPGHTHQTNMIMKEAVLHRLLGEVVLMQPPLHSLYEESSLVVVGLPVKSKKVSSSDDSTQLNTAIEVSIALKGNASRNAINFYHEVYSGDKNPLKNGQPVLLFLRPREERGKLNSSEYEAVYPRSAIKTLSDPDLASYISHIKALQDLLQQDVPSRTDFVEWVVQLAEDPATVHEASLEVSHGGYDGVFQDRPSSSADKGREVDRADVAAAESTGSTESASEYENAATGSSVAVAVHAGLESFAKEQPSCSFVATSSLFTPAQKARLLNAFLRIDKMTDEDFDALKSVATPTDKKSVLRFLLSQLEEMEENPDEFSDDLVAYISDKLDNQNLPSDDSDEASLRAGSSASDAEPTKAEMAAKAAAEKARKSEFIKRFVAAARAKL